MHQITWDEVTNIKDLKGVTPNLTEKEWAVLNDNIEYNEARRKAASVLRYLKKHILLNNGSWSKSFLNIYNMYKRSHQYISTGQLKNIVNRLKDLGLICIEKVKKRNVYTMPMAEKMAEKMADNNSIKDVENANIEADLKKHRCMDSYKDNNNIYKNTTALDSYGEVIADEQEAVVITGQVIKILKVRSKWVINAALNTIKQCYKRINRLGAFKYISKVILKLQAISKSVYKNTNVYSNAVKQYRAATIPGKEVKFNSFTQRERSKEEWQDLEHKLLGW